MASSQLFWFNSGLALTGARSPRSTSTGRRQRRRWGMPKPTSSRAPAGGLASAWRLPAERFGAQDESHRPPSARDADLGRQDLLASDTGDDVVAKVDARFAKCRDGAREIFQFEHESVSPSRLGSGPVRHRLPAAPWVALRGLGAIALTCRAHDPARRSG